MEPRSPALQADSLPAEPQGKLYTLQSDHHYKIIVTVSHCTVDPIHPFRLFPTHFPLVTANLISLSVSWLLFYFAWFFFFFFFKIPHIYLSPSALFFPHQSFLSLRVRASQGQGSHTAHCTSTADIRSVSPRRCFISFQLFPSSNLKTNLFWNNFRLYRKVSLIVQILIYITPTFPKC